MRAVICTSSYPSNPRHVEVASGFFVRDFADALAEKIGRVLIVCQDRPGVAIDDEGRYVFRYAWSAEEKILAALDLRSLSGLVDAARVTINGTRMLGAVSRQYAPDFALALWAVPSGLQASLNFIRQRVPYAVWILGSDVWNFRHVRPYRTLLGAILARAFAVYADGADLIETVHDLTGVRPEFLSSTRKLPTDGLPDPGLDPARINLVSINRFHRHKALDVLLAAYALLSPGERAQYRLTMFGGGPEERALRALAVRLGVADGVDFRGWADRWTAAAALTAADACVIPSRVESIPVLLSDALQAGAPLVATDVGEMGPLLRVSGAGLVVAPENPRALADAIRRIDKNSRQKFAAAGRHLLADKFDLAKNAAKLLADYAVRGDEKKRRG